MTSTIPIELPETLKRGGFTLQREMISGKCAVYRQHDKSGYAVGYEVVQARLKTRYRSSALFWGYPSTSAWGTDGWSCFTLEQAEDKFNAIVQAHTGTIKRETK